MKRVVLWLYIAAYATIAVVSSLDPDPKETLLEFGFGVLLTLLTLVGMILYARGVANRQLIAAWRVVPPLLVAGTIGLLVFAWPALTAPDPELTVTEQRVILAVALVVAAAVEVPAIIINFRFARGRHLADPHP